MDGAGSFPARNRPSKRDGMNLSQHLAQHVDVCRCELTLVPTADHWNFIVSMSLIVGTYIASAYSSDAARSFAKTHDFMPPSPNRESRCKSFRDENAGLCPRARRP